MEESLSPLETTCTLIATVAWALSATASQHTFAGGPMQTAAPFLAAGWDFDTIWTICEGKDYPRLRWEGVECGE